LNTRVVFAALISLTLIAAAEAAQPASAARARAPQSVPIYQNPKAPLEDRVEDLLVRLTPKEKISLMAGSSFFSTQGIERLQIPALRFSDQPGDAGTERQHPAITAGGA
jgi:hypothetical protein